MTGKGMTQVQGADARDAVIAVRCPMTDLQAQGGDRAALAGYAEFDELRQRGPSHMLNDGQIIYTSYASVLEIAQRSDEFFSKGYDPVTGDEAAFTLVPQKIDGPIHKKWRRLLAPYFAPRAMAKLDESVRDRANELIDTFIADGKCDFVKQFALRLPTAIFLQHIIGLPVEELDKFLTWENDILHAKDNDPVIAHQKAEQARTEVTAYLAHVIAERRDMPPEQRGADLISVGADWQIDDEPISSQDMLSFYLLLFMAGLDTVTGELSYGFHHLATHPADRERIVADPSVIPNAVEELLRVYSVANIARTAMTDTEVDGCPVKKGQRFILSVSSANRDEDHFRNATTVDFDRVDISHLAFGAGPHRCLGSHLARRELAIAYEEWHKRIPVYQVDSDVPFNESRSLLMGLNSLPLRWDPATTSPH